MKGVIKKIRENRNSPGMKFGFIEYNDQEIYFDSRGIVEPATMDDFSEGMQVEFETGFRNFDQKAFAIKIRAIDNISVGTESESTPDEQTTDVHAVFENNHHKSERLMSKAFAIDQHVYYDAGWAKHLDIEQAKKLHLKVGSGEFEVLNKLKDILYISYINSHNMGHENIFPYCFVGATDFLKQYIRGRYEFLLVFSHFNSQTWAQSTIRAERSIRKRKDVSERRPLINFYVLVSNARTLKQEIDKMKGGTDSAIIPFVFEEILSCGTKDELKRLIISRFDEYLFENNMLGEKASIEDDYLLFGDRGKIADSIVQRSLEGKHSGIFGLRRSGKSSILRAVERRISDTTLKYVRVEARDIETMSSWQLVLFDIAKEVRRKMTGFEQGTNETKAEYISRLRLNSTEEDYMRRPVPCFIEDINLYVGSNTLVIAIDEVELITYNTATSELWRSLDAYKGFWSALRDARCALIVCGVNSTINEENNIRYNGQSCDNPMYERIHNCAGFSKTYLPSFTDEQTKTMINTLGSYSNISFSQVYVDINRAFGGQPFAIRQFCSYIFENVKHLRKHLEVYEVTKPTFDTLLPRFNNSREGVQLFDTMLQHVELYKDEYEMLKRLAHAPDKYHSLSEQRELVAIDHIEKYGLVEYDRTTYFVTFSIKSIQDYLVKVTGKRPEDMTNDERRQYIQNCVQRCEKKLKQYLLNNLQYNPRANGRGIIRAYIAKEQIKKKTNADIDENTCPLNVFFDHNRYILYFSTLRKIICENWNQLGQRLQESGIDKNRFNYYMVDINAGRTDADHYDAEEMICPDDWEIDEQTLKKFMVAYEALDGFFKQNGL